MKNDEKEKIDDKSIILQINKFETEIKEKLKVKNDESIFNIEEYFVVNKPWIKKFISLYQKEELFKEIIYFILKKISFHPQKYIYQNNNKKYEYYNNIKIIPKDIATYLLSIIQEKNNIILTKVLLIDSKMILILEKEFSLEILNEKYYPEYLLYFGNNNNINSEKMINIYIKEMKTTIPECMNENNILFDYVTNNKNIITIINLKILLEKENSFSNKINKENNIIIDKLWEDKFKLKLEKNLNEINNKLNSDFQSKINSNTENFDKKIKDQFEQQNKIFTENYNNSVIKLNNIKGENEEKEEEEEEKEKEDEKIIINKKSDNKKINIVDDYFVIVENNKKFNVMNLKDKDKICAIFSPVLFCLSQITSLTQYFQDNQELFELYKYVENTLIDYFSDFIKRLKEINEDKINKPQKGLFKENSNLVFQFLKSKMEENSKVINSPGEILSEILENFDTEMDKYYKYEAEEDSRIELNQVKKYDIYSEIEMLQKFVDSHSTEHKTFIYEKFHTIIKTSRLCKSCKKCSYNYQSFPTLKIPLNRSNSLIADNQLDNEIYNALISKICFPENLSQLLSPSYNSIKKEHCENCKKYKEIIYNNSIFAVKQYLIVDIDRENDPKNEMIFIYPEILDLRNQSKCIINLYQLIGVITKKINDNNNKDDLYNEKAKYICYFKMKKNNKWIVFDENYKLSELKSNEKIYDFKGVSVLVYSKIEGEDSNNDNNF